MSYSKPCIITVMLIVMSCGRSVINVVEALLDAIAPRPAAAATAGDDELAVTAIACVAALGGVAGLSKVVAGCLRAGATCCVQHQVPLVE